MCLVVHDSDPGQGIAGVSGCRTFVGRTPALHNRSPTNGMVPLELDVPC